MIRILAVLVAATTIVSAAANHRSTAPAEVFIVGTVHRATTQYSVADLTAILQQIQPDLILFEYPRELMTPAFEFGLLEPDSLEQQVVLAYRKTNPVRIRPYDIDGRSAFFDRTKFFSRQADCNAQLTAHLQDRGLDADAKKVADRLREANARRDAIGAADPRTVNSFESDSAIAEKQWAMNEGIPEILRLTKDTGACVAFWDLSRAFWIRRNNEMVRNIGRIAGEFPGARLVVLAGFEHRYYLRSHLYDWDTPPDYVVKEYWEIQR